MKKYFFKIALPSIVSLLLFASCLGDAKNSFEAHDRFGVIREGATYRIYAIVEGPQGPIKVATPEIEKLHPGDAYQVSYKVENAFGDFNTIYPATITKLEKLRKAFFFHDISVPAHTDDYVYPGSFSASCTGEFGDGVGEEFGYNWRIRYNCTVEGKYTIVPEIYYDSSKQYDATSTTLKPNQIVFDVRFKKIASDTEVQKIGDVFASVDFTPVAKLNTNFRPDFNNIEPNAVGVLAMVKFRYKYVAKENNQDVVKDGYSGTWNNVFPLERGSHFFYFKKQ